MEAVFTCQHHTRRPAHLVRESPSGEMPPPLLLIGAPPDAPPPCVQCEPRRPDSPGPAFPGARLLVLPPHASAAGCIGRGGPCAWPRFYAMRASRPTRRPLLGRAQEAEIISRAAASLSSGRCGGPRALSNTHSAATETVSSLWRSILRQQGSALAAADFDLCDCI
ncbi:unnamed protein product, partial [Amoebophrya sp. A120]|eukprot:GSA120T00022429001.1